MIQPAKKYTVDGHKDEVGKRAVSLSLKHILAQCNDFKNQLSALQHLAKKMGTKVICSPKYHAEIAREGIKYCWAIAKTWFKQLPLSKRKTRQQFKAKVQKAFSSSIVTIS